MEDKEWLNYYTWYSAINSDLVNLAIDIDQDDTPVSIPNVVILTFTLLLIIVLVVITSKSVEWTEDSKVFF